MLDFGSWFTVQIPFLPREESSLAELLTPSAQSLGPTPRIGGNRVPERQQTKGLT